MARWIVNMRQALKVELGDTAVTYAVCFTGLRFARVTMGLTR
ncbi:MAG TPA: hypothetical protein VE135_10185 [Pyrinomonadaceae bacterium]|nr:hypothetical protein [Pyrinomonadaceae bacterium]